MSGEAIAATIGLAGQGISSYFDYKQARQVREETLEDRAIVNRMFTSGAAAENVRADELYGGLGQQSQGFYGTLGGRFRRLNEGLIGQSNQFFSGRGERFGEEFDPIAGGLRGNVLQAEQAGRNIIGGFQERRATGLRNLEGLGRFERSEINRRSVNRGNFAQANLLRSGLSGSTLGTSARLGNARIQGQELGGLDERLRRERLGFDAQLSGDTLRAMQGQQSFLSGLRGGTLGALGGIAQARLGTEEAAFQNQFTNQRELGTSSLIADEAAFASQFGNQLTLGTAQQDRRRSLLELRARPFESTVRQAV